MASKTPRFTLNATEWVDIGGTAVAIAGRVLSGQILLEYADTPPGAADLGIPYRAGQDFSVSIATGDKLYAKAAGATAVVAVMRRGA